MEDRGLPQEGPKWESVKPTVRPRRGAETSRKPESPVTKPAEEGLRESGKSLRKSSSTESLKGRVKEEENDPSASNVAEQAKTIKRRREESISPRDRRKQLLVGKDSSILETFSKTPVKLEKWDAMPPDLKGEVKGKVNEIVTGLEKEIKDLEEFKAKLVSDPSLQKYVFKGHEKTWQTVVANLDQIIFSQTENLEMLKGALDGKEVDNESLPKFLYTLHKMLNPGKKGEGSVLKSLSNIMSHKKELDTVYKAVQKKRGSKEIPIPTSYTRIDGDPGTAVLNKLLKYNNFAADFEKISSKIDDPSLGILAGNLKTRAAELSSDLNEIQFTI